MAEKILAIDDDLATDLDSAINVGIHPIDGIIDLPLLTGLEVGGLLVLGRAVRERVTLE